MAEYQSQCLRSQMPDATSQRWPLPRRYLRLQELGVVLALESFHSWPTQRPMDLAVTHCPTTY
ncbi:hypothetical protein ALC56_00761 [Trachymyrmex septentrionalis]|uniref:Uncharacterized protein n=1 Tax=Trachymyrmex septentrionalis TaxID=34720 RepID=A0A195FWG2_9HYME|nr:hypothetical protein ALC56_00761 [Trachymyrmex septentrionalis]